MATTLKLGDSKWATKDGSLLAYNDNNGNFKPLPFNFTRATGGTVVNKDGLIEMVSNNVPRIDFSNDANGALLLEPQRSNLIPYSEAISNWVQDGATTLDNNIISPDGTLNASKITFNSGNERVYTFANTTNGSFSAYFKGVQGKKVKFRDNSGTIITEITLTENWVRHYLYKGTSNTNIQIQNIDANEVYVWGVQVEEGSYATSYIPTQGSAVTRVADVCNGAGNSQVFNDSEGVLFAEISALANDGNERYIYLGDGTTANRVVIRFSPTINDLRILLTSGGATQVSLGTTSYNVLELNKIAFKYKQNDFALWVNGVEVLTDTSGISPSGLNQLSLSFSPVQFYGNTKQIQYFDSALTDQQLQQLTTL